MYEIEFRYIKAIGVWKIVKGYHLKKVKFGV